MKIAIIAFATCMVTVNGFAPAFTRGVGTRLFSEPEQQKEGGESLDLDLSEMFEM